MCIFPIINRFAGIAEEERRAQEELERKLAEEEAERQRIAEEKRRAEEEKRREEEAKRLGEELVSSSQFATIKGYPKNSVLFKRSKPDLYIQPEEQSRASQMEQNARGAAQARIIDLDVSYKN